MNSRGVQVTGVGIVSPVGLDAACAWRNLVAGKSGIRRLACFDVGHFNTGLGGHEAYGPSKDVRRMDTFVHFRVGAGAEAIEGRNLETTDVDRKRIGWRSAPQSAASPASRTIARPTAGLACA